MLTVETADVRFDHTRPYSTAFNDVYYDAEGAAETLRVFLAPADIEARSARAGLFTVAELGFGTGLNFIVTAARARCRELHFVSFERHPLSAQAVARALSPWRDEYPVANDLVRAWPPALAGWHRRHFDNGRVRLSVWHGDVAEGLEDFARQQRRGVDAWYLDGFAPRRNRAMWRPELFRTMARCCASAATVTTFTAAGQVRRDLEAAGFEGRRVDQRPHKRHSTAAIYRGAGISFKPPPHVNVLGAGLAGAGTARALAERGVDVTVADPAGIAAGASAVPSAILHGRLHATATAESRLRAHAFAYSAARLDVFAGTRRSGALQAPGANADAGRLARIAAIMPPEFVRLLDGAEATELAGIPIPDAALYRPGALTVDGGACVRALLDHPRIQYVANADRESTTALATGAHPGAFDYLEVTGIGGQMDLFRSARVPALPVVGHGSLVPDARGVWAGATYEYRPWTADDAERANAERLSRWLGVTPAPAIATFRSVRAVTSDRLPIVGRDDEADTWFNLGHGSHGTVTAPFGAECLASRIIGEVAPTSTDILDLMSPNRFRRRQRRRPNPFRRRTTRPGAE